MTGVGPVEAGVALGAELAGSKRTARCPISSSRWARPAAAALEQTEIYQAVSVSYRDMDASPLGFEKGATPFLDLPATVPLPLRIPGIKEATLSTGATIISGDAYDAIAADMVDMETFAVPARLPALRRAADRPARHFRRRGRSAAMSATGRNICMSSTRSWRDAVDACSELADRRTALLRSRLTLRGFESHFGSRLIDIRRLAGFIRSRR